MNTNHSFIYSITTPRGHVFRMIYAKNHRTVTKFVKVMSRILWPLFSRTRCI